MSLAEKIQLERERFALAKKRLRDSKRTPLDWKEVETLNAATREKCRLAESFEHRAHSLSCSQVKDKKLNRISRHTKCNYENSSKLINNDMKNLQCAPGKHKSPSKKDTVSKMKFTKPLYETPKDTSIKRNQKIMYRHTHSHLRENSNRVKNNSFREKVYSTHQSRQQKKSTESMEENLRKSILSQAVLEAKNSNAEASIRELERESLGKTHACNLLKQQIADLKEKNCRLEEKVSEKTKTLLDAQAELNAAEIQIDAISQRCKDENKEAIKVGTELERIKNEYASFRTESEASLDTLKREVLALNISKSEQQQDLLLTKEKLGKFESKYEEEREKKEKALDDIKVQKSELEKLKAETSGIKITLRLSETQLKAAKCDHEELEKANNKLESRCQQLENELEKEKNTNIQIADEKQKQLLEAQALSGDLKQETNQVLEKLERVSRQLENEKSRNKSQSEDLNHEVERLQQQLTQVSVNARAEADASAELVRIKSSTIIQLKEQIEALKNASREADAQVLQINDLKKENQQLKDSNDQKQELLSQEIQNLKDENTSTEEKYQKLLAEKDSAVKVLKAEAKELRECVKMYLEKEQKVKESKLDTKNQEQKFDGDSEELIVDVDLPNGKTAELVVRKGESPNKIVQNFSQIHNISERVSVLLEKYIISQLNLPVEKGSPPGTPRFDASPRAKSKKDIKSIQILSPPPPPPTNDIESEKIRGKNRRLSRLKRINT